MSDSCSQFYNMRPLVNMLCYEYDGEEYDGETTDIENNKQDNINSEYNSNSDSDSEN